MDKYCLVECIGFNILPNISRGGEILEGGNFNPKKGKFWYILPYKIQFLPLNLQIFAIFPQENANLDNLFLKKVPFWTIFHLWKWKIWGYFFTIFFSQLIFLAEYLTMVECSIQFTKDRIGNDKSSSLKIVQKIC